MSRFVLTAQLQLQAPSNIRQVVNQIQSQLAGVNIPVNVQNAASATRQINQIRAATNDATTAAERMGTAFGVSLKRFASFSIATRAVGLFTNGLAGAIRDAIEFERQLIKVAQVSNQSIASLKGLTSTITELATSLGVESKSLLEVSTILKQAGLSANETAIALRTLAKAALAPNFDSITETTEGAIAILAQFGLGVQALEGQLSSIDAVAGAFAVEAADLIDVIRRTGGVFKSSGGDLNELLALFTSVRATTRESAESIGTGLRTIFTRIQRPKTIEYLKQFGIELVDLEGRFVGPFEAVKRLSAALNGLGEGDLTFIRIAEELGGFRQIGKVLPLLQQFAIAQQALNVAQKAGDGLTTNAITAQQALAIRITKVKEEFLAFIRGVTESRGFQLFVNTALNLASAFIKIGEALTPVIPLLTAMMAINISRGIGSFLTSIPRGMASGRFSNGGRVLGFEKGGMVPGVGNRDSVPAMLTPGEVVMNRAAVQKYGAGNLVKMNNRAKGGPITVEKASDAPSGKPIKSYMLRYKELNQKDKILGNIDRKTIDEEKIQKYYNESSNPKKTFASQIASNAKTKFTESGRTKEFSFGKGLAFEDFIGAYLTKVENKSGYRKTKNKYDPLDFVGGGDPIEVRFRKDPTSDETILAKRLRHTIKYSGLPKGFTSSIDDKPPVNIGSTILYQIDPNLKKEIGLNSGGIVQRFEEGGVAQRRVGIIDTDVLRDKKNAARVAEGMKLLDAKSEADYGIKLSKLAGEARQSGALGRFSVMAGAAANRKSSVATGRGANDNATLRKTTRKQILHPDDLKDVDQVMSLTTTLKESKLDYMGMADRIYVKDSSTEDEQKLVKLFERQRNLQKDPTLYGRETGTTEGLNSDYGLQTASLISQFGTTEDRTNKGKVMTLGEKTDQAGTPRFQIRRKRLEELPELASAKGQFPGAASPLTRGHAESAVGTLLEKVREKYPDATHKDLLFALAPDLSLDGGSQGREHGSRYGEYPASFRRDLIKLALPEMMISSANSPSQTGINSRIAEIEKGATGRRRFAVMEKDAPVVISKAENENPEGVMERYRSAGLTPYNIARSADTEGDSISGTATRQAVIDKDYAKLDLAVLPKVGSAIKSNQPQLRNRRMMVPLVQQALDIFTQANTSKVNEQVDGILQNASGGPFTRMTPKFKEAHPNLVKQITSLRKNRDIFQRDTFLDPAHELIRIISDRYPDIYGLDASRKEPIDIPVTEDSVKQHIVDSSKSSSYFRPGLSFNGDGIQLSPTLQKVKDAVDKEVKSEQVSVPQEAKEIVAPNSRSDIFKVLSRDEAAVASGVDQIKTYDIMGLRRELTPEEQKVKDAVKEAYVQKVKRQGASAKAQTTKLRGKGLEFGAAGLFGKAFAAKNIKIESDKLSSSRMVRVISGVMDQATATRLSTTMSQGVSNIISQGTDIVTAGKSKSPVTQSPLQGLNANTNATIQGGLIEQIIQQLGGPGAVKGKGFDFPEGLQGAAKYFNIDPNVPTDVKRTLSGPSTIKDNIVTYLKNVMGYNSGGTVRKFAKAGKVGFGTGTTEFPKRISNAYEREIRDAQLKKASEQIFNNTYSSPKNETMSIDANKVREAHDKPFDKNRFLSTFTGKIKRDSLYQDMADFTKLIGLPSENIDLALPKIIDFVPNLKSLGQFDRTGMTSRGVESLDVSGAGFTKAHEQDLYGYKKLIEEKRKQADKITKTPVKTYDDGSFSYDTEAARAVWDELGAAQNNYGKVSSLKSTALEQTIQDIQGKAAKTGRGSISVRTSDPFRSSSTGGDSSTLYHEMTHQLINGLRTRNAESFTKYKERVLQLFTGDNDDLSEAFDALNSSYSSADVVYGKSYKVSNLNNIISSNKNKLETTPNSETAHQEALGLWVKSMGIKKAREFKPLNPDINQTLLNNGLKQSYIDRIEDSGKEEFLTTLVQNANKLDGVLSSTLDATLNELLGNAGIQRQSYSVGGLADSTDQMQGLMKGLYGNRKPSEEVPAKKEKNYGKIGLRSDGNTINASYFKNDQREGYVSAYKMRDYLYYVGLSKATQGYGPKLYDTVMEEATSKGAMLTSDRSSVSGAAKKVWEYYFKNRGDVKKTPLKPDDWTRNQAAIDPKLYGKPETWPAPTDPAWILQSGYSKSPSLINDKNSVIRMGDNANSGAMALQYFSRANGGRLGFETGGTVPALVSNGEAYVPPQIAKKIGYGKLNRMNQADRNGMSGFSGGGGISVFKGPGTGTSDSIPANLPVGSFIVRAKATKALGLNKGGRVRFSDGGGAYGEKIGNLYDVRETLKEQAKTATGNESLVIAQKLKEVEKEMDTLVTAYSRLADTIDQATKDEESSRNALDDARSRKDIAKEKMEYRFGGQPAGFDAEARRRGDTPFPFPIPSGGTPAGGTPAGTPDAGAPSGTPASGGGEKSNKSMFTFSQALTGASAALNGLIQTAGGTDDAFTRIASAALSSVTAISSSLSILESVAGIEIKGFSDIATIPQKLGETFAKVGATLDEKVGKFFGISSSSVGFEKLFSSLGAVAGVATITASAFSAAAGILYSTSTTVAEYDKAMADGNIALVGTLSARKTAEEDIINSGGIFAGGIVAVAAIVPLFLASVTSMIPPLAGLSTALYSLVVPLAIAAAAIVGIGAIVLYATGNLENFANGTRDILSSLTGGWIQSTSTIQQFAQATAATSHTMKLMQDQAKQTTQALKDLSEGRKSAKEVLNQFSGQAQSVANAQSMATRLPQDTAKEKKDRDESIKKANENKDKVLSEAAPAINAQARNIAVAGGNFADFFASLPKELQAVYNQNPAELKLLKEAFGNTAKEVEIARKQFEAMNLGLRNVTSVTGAAVNSVTNFTAGLQAGNLAVAQSANTLTAALTAAGANISQNDFNNALNDVTGTMQSLGASDQQVAKFKDNLTALAQVQRNAGGIFDQLKEDIKAGGFTNMSPEAAGDKFRTLVDQQLKDSGIGDEARKRIGDALGDIEIGDKEREQIAAGDYSFLLKKLDEAGVGMTKEVNQMISDLQKVNSELNTLYKQRIESERSFVEAQRQSIALNLEGLEIQSKYGGRAVTPEIKRQAAIESANAGRRIAGVGDIRGSDPASLRAGLNQIRGNFAALEQKALQGKVSGQQGVKDEAIRENLKKAQQDQVKLIRDLISAEEEQLKLTKEKNKLEKDSLESLLAGDIDKFFEQQAAVGATAAIGTGNQAAINQFGGQALGGAYQNLQRQKEAGVTELFGQRIAGAGGLLESSATASLGSRGIQNPRMAQILAGTTQEEEASNRRLREYGGLLGEAGATGAEMAAMEVSRAEMNIATAELKIQNAGLNTDILNNQPQNRSRGGIVYASKGQLINFVPKGTDTVPAMLTPGEFVVNRGAVNRGDNLSFLRSINNGQYTANAQRLNNNPSSIPNIFKQLTSSPQSLQTQDTQNKVVQNERNISNVNFDVQKLSKQLGKFMSGFDGFMENFSEQVGKLGNTEVSHKLGDVNLNINGGQFLQSMADGLKQQLMEDLGQKLQGVKVNNVGNIKFGRTSVL